ncbi:uncharacterized protein METZ01_LOCUS210529 [marine metagenome]|uniref:Uncharacterized protein n=1 Tax=marine metagenome TaxID=408172 RepID=A0A382F4R0_9ZZZZ
MVKKTSKSKTKKDCFGSNGYLCSVDDSIGQYMAALISVSFLLVDYLQHRNKK